MPEVRIVRLEQTAEGALGSMVLLGELFCTTLEPDAGDPARNQIPAGVYKCRRFHGAKWPDTFEITVPGHTAVLFHAGNTETDTQMCVLLGQYPGKLNFGTAHLRAVLNSGITFKRFLEILADKQEFTAEFIDMHYRRSPLLAADSAAGLRRLLDRQRSPLHEEQPFNRRRITMKVNKTNAGLILIMLLCLACLACDKEFTTNAYKTLSAGATVYEQAYPAFLEAHEKGLVTDEQKDQGKELATRYWAAYHAASDALIVYNDIATAENKDKVNVAIAAMSRALSSFTAYIQPFITGGE